MLKTLKRPTDVLSRFLKKKPWPNISVATLLNHLKHELFKRVFEKMNKA